MIYVYRLTVKSRAPKAITTVVDMLYKNESDAQNHADHYREAAYPYHVTVTRMEVY